MAIQVTKYTAIRARNASWVFQLDVQFVVKEQR